MGAYTIGIISASNVHLQPLYCTIRDDILLLFASTCCFLALSCVVTFLEGQISIPLKSLSDGKPCQIYPYHMYCDWSYFSVPPCGGNHVPVCLWEIYYRSSEGRTWIWNYSFSSAAVYRETWWYHILFTGSAYSYYPHDWHTCPDHNILDYTQSERMKWSDTLWV